MAKMVILAPQADDDLRAIRAWYGQAGTGPMAARNILAIVAAITALGDFPLIGREGRSAGTREHIVRQHRIVYRLRADRVIVLAIFGPGQSDRAPP